MWKQYRITYFLKPEFDNITVTIAARSYEEACVMAKEMKQGYSFSVQEL
jgi:hypothetical protein